MSDLERATENKLVRGRASSPRVRVQQAGAADLDALERICGLADMPFETPLCEAIAEQMAEPDCAQVRVVAERGA